MGHPSSTIQLDYARPVTCRATRSIASTIIYLALPLVCYGLLQAGDDLFRRMLDGKPVWVFSTSFSLSIYYLCGAVFAFAALAVTASAALTKRRAWIVRSAGALSAAICGPAGFGFIMMAFAVHGSGAG